MKHLITILALVFGSTAYATDAYNFHNYGFSADSRYYGFVQSVQQDGSGYHQAKAYVVDVAANRLVATQTILLDDFGSEKEAIKEVLKRVNFAKYGITGKIGGRTLWMRMPTDLSAPNLNPLFSTNYWVDGGASSVTPKFQLQLTESAAPVGNDCYLENPTKLTLTLARDGGSPVEIQRDVQLPKSRSCVNRYQPRQVIEHNGAMVVVVRYESQGFEGPDYNYMVITNSEALK